jgi:multiple sugar transport system permease protein
MAGVRESVEHWRAEDGLTSGVPAPSFEMLLLIPSIVGLAIISLIPLVAILWLSVYEIAFGAGETEFVALQNFQWAMTQPEVLSAWWVTTLYVGGALVLELGLGLLIAVSLHNVSRGDDIFTTIVIMPMMIAPVVVGLLWQFLLNTSFGMYAYIMQQLPLLPNTSVLANEGTALIALVVMDAWQWTPLIVLILFAQMKSIPSHLYEASRIDGATSWEQFRYVTLPLIKQGVAIALLLRSMDLLRFIDKIFITTGGGPASSTKVISFFVYEHGLRYQNFGQASALGIIVLIVTVLLGLVFVETIMGGAGDDE